MGIYQYKEQFEAYFSGEMSGPDRILFEGRVESNPELKYEFDRQNNIVEGLRAHRIAELKTRLNGISVEPTLIASLLESSLIKSISYGIAGVAIATSGYLFLESNSRVVYELEQLNHKSLHFNNPKIRPSKFHSLDYRYDFSENQLSIVEKPEPTSVITREKLVITKKENHPDREQISFEVPTVNEDTQEEEFSGKEVDLKALKKIDKVTGVSDVEKVDIQMIHSRKYNFHYRLEDNRLFLYGKFGASPYEIIEISSPENKKLFFYYQDNFYRLKKGARAVTPLIRIENTDLIQKLKDFKDNQ